MWAALIFATITLVVVLWRIRCRPLFLPLAASVAAALVAGWFIAGVLIATDPTGAGGHIDCWPDCSLYQRVISLAIFGFPVVLLMLLVEVLIIVLVRRIGRFR